MAVTTFFARTVNHPWSLTALSPTNTPAVPDRSTALGTYTNFGGMDFSPDGTKLLGVDGFGKYVGQQTITAWTPDASTVSGWSGFSAQITTPEAARYGDGGTKLFVSGNKKLCTYDLAVPYDITNTPTYVRTLNLSTKFDPSGNVDGFYWHTTGQKLYIASGLYGKVIEYTVLTPWDTSDMIESNEWQMPKKVDVVDDVYCNIDLTKMFILNSSAAEMWEMNMETVGSISAASFSLHQKRKVLSSGGIFIKPGGGIFYHTSTSGSVRVYEFDLV